MDTLDFDIESFSKFLACLPDHFPISDAMQGRDKEDSDDEYSDVWYDSQREHMEAWFFFQQTHGAGAYSRDVRNFSSKKTYNRLLCAPALIWMAEAVGADTELIQKAADEASQLPYRSQCRCVRKYLPWDMIARLALEKSYDLPAEKRRENRFMDLKAPRKTC